jgi:Family of unknown function (DUF5994)
MAMLSTAERRTAISPAPPSSPRLRLQPDLPAGTLLDGGWWPRSTDPAAELPGLILAIDQRHGPVTQIMLGRTGWDANRPGRLRVDGPAGSRVVRLGWFETMPAGLLIATARAGRTDLLTVPPDTSEPAARAAMDQAARAGNRTPAPALLAAITTAVTPARRQPAPRREPAPAGTAPDSVQLSTRESEGGHASPLPPGLRLAAAAGRR